MSNEENRTVEMEVSHLKKYYKAGRHSVLKAVDDVSFQVYKGETFGLVGESGCGKTTCGKTCLGMLEKTEGQVLYQGNDVHAMTKKERFGFTKKVQMIFQDPYASLNPHQKVYDIIAEGIQIHKLAKNREEEEKMVFELLNMVGLNAEHASRNVHEFSGGQRQRIGLARAMIMEPELVVADEPISALDVSIRAQVLNLLKKFQREQGTTYLFIAHDLSIVRFISDRIGVIYKGDIVEVAEAEELFNFPMHPYTRSLISAIPIPDPQLEKNKDLFTYDPSMHDYSEDKPEMVDIGNNHFVYGNKKEIEAYKELRAKNEPIKSITIRAEGEAAKTSIPTEASPEEIRMAPARDTGSYWYNLLGFLLPLLSLIGAHFFRVNNYIRNFKALKKGAVVGLIFRAVLLGIFALLLVLAVI